MTDCGIVLLHGALGSSIEWNPVISCLPDGLDIRALNFPGHAETPGAENLSLDSLKSFLENYLVENFPNRKVVICGHSLGGYLGICLASAGNPAIAGVITIGTKFHWNPEIASRENSYLNFQKLQEKVPSYAGSLEKLHGSSNIEKLLQQIQFLLTELGESNPLAPENLTSVMVPCRIMLGDKDQMVTREETLSVTNAIQNAGLSILPDTKHPMAKVNPRRLAFEITDFIQANNL